MGLASALSTALTGLSAAETTIDVVGNNLANANTVGFKASTASFATQFLQTQSLGSAPTDDDGGSNPTQTGLGTIVADITPDFSQGTIEVSTSATDLAIQGDGFFLVQGESGEQFYTRNGSFETNASNELVTLTGNRVLGYGVDGKYNLVTTSLTSITIPLGTSAVAQATENVYLEGTLSPTGDLGTRGAIIETEVLGDSSYTRPGDTASAEVCNVPVGMEAEAGGLGGSMNVGDRYSYRIVFVDTTGTEGMPSDAVEVGPLVAGETLVNLSELPTQDGVVRRLYRTDNTGTGDWELLYEFDVSEDDVDTFIDYGTIATGDALDTTTIEGTYSYYITFADAAGGPPNGTESCPCQVIEAAAMSTDGRIQLADLPTDSSGQWTVMRIYRCLATDNSHFYFVAEIDDVTTEGQTWTDNVPDSDIEDNAQINFNGPVATSSTLVTNLLRRDGETYESVFTDEGTFQFTGTKGGSDLTTKELEITETTTLGDLVDFMTAAMGIQSPPGEDPDNPIAPDGSGLNPGGYVTADGKIRFVGNSGTANGLSIDLSGMQLETDAGTTTVNMPFSTTQAATGESAVTDCVVYDSLGIALNVRITAVLESRSQTATTYRWYADSANNVTSTSDDSIAVGTGLITFDSSGNFLSATNTQVRIYRADVTAQSPLTFDLQFDQISGLATDESTLSVSQQDGSAPGTLTSFIIGEDGLIRGVFSNGITRTLGQIVLARFSNASGLEQKGENLYSAGVNSGLPIVGTPGQQGIGTIVAGAVELSNTDVGGNLIDLILASTMYRGNTRVITTVQDMLDELLALRR